jgi:DNA-binding GntR family transcriptional regulator
MAEVTPHTSVVRPTSASSHRRTMTQEAVSALREMIVMGSLPPGAPLRLEDLARSLGMSISPIREAVRQLEVLGFAEHIPYKGAHVTYLSLNELHIVHDVRVGLESVAVRHAAESFGRSLDERMTECLNALAAAYESADRPGLVHRNTAYHLALAEGSGSTWLARLIGQTLQVWERYSAAVTMIDRYEDTYAVEAEGHRQILEACRRRDPDAAEEMLRAHLAVSKEIFERGARGTIALQRSRDD